MTIAPDMTPLLEITDLSLEAQSRFGHRKPIVKAASLSARRNAIHAVVGESGSGKTLLAKSVVDLLPPSIVRVGGDITFDGRSITGLSLRQMRRIRGAEIGFVFQEPMISLNPVLTVGAQMEEAISLHLSRPRHEIRDLCLDMLDRVSIKDPKAAFNAYPHEYSGGMRQRIMLASVLSLRPKLLIADEPTTALDAIIQRDVLDIMVELATQAGTTVLLITHDLGLVGEYADDVTVMQTGTVVEDGACEAIFSAPRDAYTKRLLTATPKRGDRPAVAGDRKTVLATSDLHVDYAGKRSWPWSKRRLLHAVNDVTLDLAEGETVAIVGESGSGKSSLGRAIIGLTPVSRGAVHLDGFPHDPKNPKMRQTMRRSVQMVFQDPASSLDPRYKVFDLVAEGLRVHASLAAAEIRARVVRALEDVGIAADFQDRFPHELSGGQKQRIAIARAIVMRPRIVIADEPVSALDLTVQAQVLDLMTALQRRYGFSYLFISHDLGVVEQIADRVIVMRNGRIVESGPRDVVFDRPLHPYTRRLLAASVDLRPSEDGGFRARRRAPPLPDAALGTLPFYEGGTDYTLAEMPDGQCVALVG